MAKTGLFEIGTLLNSRRSSILVQTFEEQRFLEDLKLLAEQRQYEILDWSITAGLRDLSTGSVVELLYDPIKLMNYIRAKESNTIFVVKDFHDIWVHPNPKRALRDTLENNESKYYCPIILVSPQASIPRELEKLITVVNYELPDKEEVVELLEGMESYLESKDLPKPEGREREAIIHALTGMTNSEIVNVLKKSVAKNHKIVLDEIVKEKEQVIKKTGLLEYITKLGKMEDVGGMDIFKDWLEDAKYAFDPEARQYNVDAARGAVIVGVTGSGKSLLSKSVAHLWNLPLIQLKMSNVMDSKVGQSEKNIDRALKLAEAVSPCILWVDELEKALAGVSSSDRTDGGTLSRVAGTLLTWLSDKEAPVFVIATANNITALPDELTRAGRFDELFFASLPSPEERQDILSIHLRKRGYKVGDYNDNIENIFGDKTIVQLAEQMEDFTGAEIEQVVSEAGRRAYADFKKGNRESHYITQKDLEIQIGGLVPMSQRNPQLIADLREWAKTSAKCSSTYEHEKLHGTRDKDAPKLFSISSMSDLELDK